MREGGVCVYSCVRDVKSLMMVEVKAGKRAAVILLVLKFVR